MVGERFDAGPRILGRLASGLVARTRQGPGFTQAAHGSCVGVVLTRIVVVCGKTFERSASTGLRLEAPVNTQHACTVEFTSLKYTL